MSTFENNKKFYTIGCSLYQTLKDCSGFYVFDKLGLPYILTDISKIQEKDTLVVFEDYLSAQNYVRYLARCYRYEFRSQVSRRKHFSTGRFYVKKIKQDIKDFLNQRSCIITYPTSKQEKINNAKYYKIL